MSTPTDPTLSRFAIRGDVRPSPAALTYTIRRPGHAAWAERVPVHRVAVELGRANDVMPGHVAFPDRPIGLDALAEGER